MVNPFKEVNWHPDTAARRAFAKSYVVGFPCLSLAFLAVCWLRGKSADVSFALKFGGLGAGAGALFYLVPASTKPFYVIWYALTCCIGFVVGNMALALIFFGLVTGIGLLKRLGRRQLIRKTPDRLAETYWIDAPPAPEAKRYFNQY